MADIPLPADDACPAPLADHMASCPHCQEWWRMERLSRQIISGLPDQCEPPAFLWTRIAASLQQPQPASWWIRARRWLNFAAPGWAWQMQTRRAGYAASIGLFLVFTASLAGTRFYQSYELDQQAQQLMDDYIQRRESTGLSLVRSGPDGASLNDLKSLNPFADEASMQEARLHRNPFEL